MGFWVFGWVGLVVEVGIDNGAIFFGLDPIASVADSDSIAPIFSTASVAILEQPPNQKSEIAVTESVFGESYAGAD